MADVPQSLTVESEAGSVLAVEFRRVEDRFWHEIVAIGSGRRVIASSIEGDPSETWPPSPALQQLSIQPLPDGNQVALLVGMAGKSHFSLSVTADQENRRLVFEAACRYQQVPLFVGSKYQLAAPGQIHFALNDSLPTVATPHDDGMIVHPARADWPPPALARWWYAVEAE